MTVANPTHPAIRILADAPAAEETESVRSRREPACLVAWLIGGGWLILLLFLARHLDEQWPGDNAAWDPVREVAQQPLIAVPWLLLGVALPILLGWFVAKRGWPISRWEGMFELTQAVGDVRHTLTAWLSAHPTWQQDDGTLDARIRPAAGAWLGARLRLELLPTPDGSVLHTEIVNRLDWGLTRSLQADLETVIASLAASAGRPVIPMTRPQTQAA